MGDSFSKGDRVEWNSHGGKRKKAGTATGRIVEKVTKTRTIKGHTAKATPDDPQYVVETDAGKRAIHKPGALRKPS
jgi:Hypervirulence associated proteins TUDOR domain